MLTFLRSLGQEIMKESTLISSYSMRGHRFNTWFYFEGEMDLYPGLPSLIFSLPFQNMAAGPGSVGGPLNSAGLSVLEQ